MVDHKKVSEKSIEAEITTMLQINGWRVHKIDVIHAIVDHGKKGRRRIEQGDAGQPDLIAVRARMRGILGTTGNITYPDLCKEVLYIECKRPGENARPHQKAFHAVLRNEGFPVIVARSWEDVVKQYPAVTIRPEER